MSLCKKRRDTCGVPAGYAVSGGLDRLPLDRLPMGQLDIKMVSSMMPQPTTPGRTASRGMMTPPGAEHPSMLMSRAATRRG